MKSESEAGSSSLDPSSGDDGEKRKRGMVKYLKSTVIYEIGHGPTAAAMLVYGNEIR